MNLAGRAGTERQPCPQYVFIQCCHRHDCIHQVKDLIIEISAFTKNNDLDNIIFPLKGQNKIKQLIKYVFF